ncbi:26700_t:CDS:2, partial [Racocetra persica]
SQRRGRKQERLPTSERMPKRNIRGQRTTMALTVQQPISLSHSEPIVIGKNDSQEETSGSCAQ